jgi:hypothetical protein
MAGEKLYQFYDFETESPFVNDETGAEMFWSYERIFERKYSYGKFNPDNWVGYIDKTDHSELYELLTKEPVDKEELFKMFLYNLLMIYLPGKYGEGHTHDHFLKLYYRRTE